ncbi:polysaccharide pyruvyl transferase family protein [Christensenella tenuis]|uniref:Polysaccharide pyruvyl transferase family protein n=1 Tax=Christensenella tenuis TaxID=2763033 RepID=A0ABR7EDK9_9FIRM|nr:polysaccharide pyruvyl transferase family protein [Christensenella tenuis]
MKIGILTVYNSNYGSYFQAESLCRAVREMGHTCEIINANARYHYPKRLFTKLCIGELAAKCAPRRIIEFLRSKSYDFDTYMSLKPDVEEEQISSFWPSMKEQTKRYDCVIVGGDELWSVAHPLIGYFPAFFGHEIECPHISYAVCGLIVGEPAPKMIEKMAVGLKTFDFLSARDEPTAEMVERLSGKHCEIVIDPTLLNPYFASEGNGGGGYIIVYGQHYDEKQVQEIKGLARRTGWKLKAVAWHHDDWCDEFVKVESGQHLQDLFARSEYSVPSTFHGTIFSILNKRPFTAFMAPARQEKVTRLLKLVGLENRIFASDKQEEIGTEINYASVEDQLEDLRKKSYDFLKRALSAIEGEKK